MILKVVLLFLVFIAVLAMFGKLRLLKGLDPRHRPVAKRCRACGTPRAGPGPCPCGKG